MVKVDRTPNPPASLAREALKAHGSYREPDVISQLESDFHGKCYLCEIQPLQNIEVEHLRPHFNYKRKELVFDWNNLFLSCPHCNSYKKETKYDDHILDCCSIDPEDILAPQIIDNHVAVTALTSDIDARLTAELIESCFEKRNTGIRESECQVRVSELLKTMDVLYSILSKYKKSENQKRYICSLRSQLSRSSKFASFKRFYVRAHRDTYPELQGLLD